MLVSLLDGPDRVFRTRVIWSFSMQTTLLDDYVKGRAGVIM